MNRRGMGRGRFLVAVGALVTLIGCFPPWYRAGGDVLPALTGNAFEGAGILVFVAAVALLALILLPYAAGDERMSLDRGAVFLVAAGVGVAGFLLRLLQMTDRPGIGPPDRSPGLRLAGLGLAIVGWGVAEILSERPITPR